MMNNKNEDEVSKHKSTSNFKEKHELELETEGTIEHPFLGSKINFNG